MNNYILLMISLAAALIGNIARKYYTDKVGANRNGYFLYTAVGCLVAALMLLFWGSFGTASAFTITLAIAFGLVTAFQSVTNMLALEFGPLSYTTVIISFSTLISALSGVLLFDESLGILQIVGILFMLVSFVFATEKKSDEKKTSPKWLCFCLAAFFSTGAIGVMQKVHQSSAYSEELNAFLVISFSVCATASAVTAFAVHSAENRSSKAAEGNEDEANTRKLPRRKLFLILTAVMVLSGVCIAVNNKLNLYLSGVMDSAVFFPIVNGGGLILTSLAAIIIFGERLSKKQLVGLCCGIISILLLCIS